MAQLIKVVFFGTSEFAVPALETLKKEGYEIVAVITNPDEPAGRKQILTPPPVKVVAERLRLRIFQPRKLEIGNWKLEIPDVDFDIGVIAAYGKIIPAEIINLPRCGILNIHPSLLPKYRGPTPIQSAILNDEKETGVTIIKIDEEVDHGQIIAISQWPIANNKTYYKELENELAKMGAELLIKTLPDYLAGKIKPWLQDHSRATFTKKFTREDGRIDWHKPAEQIYNQFRAFHLQPGIWTTWKGKILKITDCSVGKKTPVYDIMIYHKLGGLVKSHDNKTVVLCSDSFLEINKVQLEGSKEMDVKSFLAGHKDFIGSKLE